MVVETPVRGGSHGSRERSTGDDGEPWRRGPQKKTKGLSCVDSQEKKHDVMKKPTTTLATLVEEETSGASPDMEETGMVVVDVDVGRRRRGCGVGVGWSSIRVGHGLEKPWLSPEKHRRRKRKSKKNAAN